MRYEKLSEKIQEMEAEIIKAVQESVAINSVRGEELSLIHISLLSIFPEISPLWMLTMQQATYRVWLERMQILSLVRCMTIRQWILRRSQLSLQD